MKEDIDLTNKMFCSEGRAVADRFNGLFIDMKQSNREKLRTVFR